MLQLAKLRLFNDHRRVRSMRDEKKPGRLRTLLAAKQGRVIPLPPKLARLYGDFRLPTPRGRPRVLSNFVTTLDGVVSLKIQGHEGGGDISGFSAEDRMVMGLLRAVADVVILGGGSLAADPGRLWTAEAICPELAGEFRRLRTALKKDTPALRVVVSASGHLEPRSAAFESGAPLVIVTGRAGARRVASLTMPASVQVRVVAGRGRGLSAAKILGAVCGPEAPSQVLVEGGPQLLGGFHAERLIDEQFLTLAPQLAGREADDGRISLVMGQSFAPKDPRWGRLADVRRSGSHLFLRYGF
jgi:riboflavin biosynthesis pyrimidine reductase